MNDYSVRTIGHEWIVEDPDGEPVCDKHGRAIRFQNFNGAAALAAALRASVT